MQKKSLIIFTLLLSVTLSSCYEGYTGSEGEKLKEYLSPENLKALVENPKEEIWIIDVRPRKKYIEGHIPTARSFPSSELENRLSELPKEKYLILYCETGGRAQAVIKTLEENAYTRLMNWGGFGRWPYEAEAGE